MGRAGRHAAQPRDYLRLARELGLAGVHFADLRHFDSLAEPDLRAVRAEAEQACLRLELGTGGTDPDHLEAALQAAYHLGSAVLRTFAGGFRWEADLAGPELVARAWSGRRRGSLSAPATPVLSSSPSAPRTACW